MSNNEAIKGGEFLIKETAAKNIFIPEDFDEEQRMIADTCSDFIKQEIEPILDRIEKQEEGLSASLMEKAGELGLLGISVPENLGGFGKDFVTSMLTSEIIGGAHSFAVSISAHTGIGTLPILYYGNEEQKQKYIPNLATGVWKAAYCLTEPSSGSDANSAKSKATLSEDGKHYILNGQKMWITNAGFADIFTDFAKIDDDKDMTAFIIEKDFGGVTLNPEEQKLGIKGSSTRQVFFNDTKVPVENLLGERQGGFKIALNILNIGRIKLAGSAIGGSKKIISQSVNYANEREQFGRPISKYGAIKFKLAEQCIKIFASESAVYRCSQNIDDATKEFIEGGMSKEEATLEGIRQFAAEAAILKVHASEALDYVVDEGLQIYGGMGYSAEAPMESAYCDARINRIFEGTNEINRMLLVDMLLKRAMKGELDLMGPAQAVAKELMSIPDFGEGSDDVFEKAHNQVKNFKKAALMVAGSAAQTLMMELAKEQEVLMNISDMIIELYIAESVLLRVEKLTKEKENVKNLEQIDMMNVYLYDTADKINKFGKDALNSFAEGDELRMMLMGLKRFTKQEPFNVKEARRRIANRLITENKYCY
ncbi:MAG: acyl-CoA dehydrogenase family protein [Flavobacteriales bacterium]|nr:acyl-CoA dehydrogenase family protein [Flavobacteriales bacterium]